MTQQATRQIALMTLFICCITIIAVVVAAGLNVAIQSVVTQTLPLAIVCGAALAIILHEPADRTR